jgi:hypothetical protein
MPLYSVSAKYCKIDFYAKCAFVIILAASVLRVVLIALAPMLYYDGDEATMNLMALHIAYQGDHPLFFYGQSYMGSLEAYLGAGLFRLFGPSIFTMRLGLVLLYALFLCFMYQVSSLLYSKRLALFVLVLLSLGATPILKHQLRAVGGYPETILFGALLFLIACRLALFQRRDTPCWRIVLYISWGIAAGLALWSDMLTLPFVLTTSLLLLLACWRELLRYSICFLLLGLLLGSIPLLNYNLSAVPGQDSLSVLLAANNSGYFGQPIPPLKYGVGALFISLPYSTGIYPGCAPSAFPFFGQGQQRDLHCLLLQGSWGCGYLLLLCLALLLAINALWRLRPAAYNPVKERTRQLARLMLLSAALLTLVIYVHSPTSALGPSPNARYLVGLLVATPALLWPLWNGTGLRRLLPRQIELVGIGSRAALLFMLLVVFFLGTIGVFRYEVPPAQKVAQLQSGLAQNLLRLGATRIYTDYWTCHRLAFESRERIICSALTANLKQDKDRYLPYRRIVQSASNPTYVFPVGSAQARNFEKFMRDSHQSYQRWTFDEYRVYKPAGHVKVP